MREKPSVINEELPQKEIMSDEEDVVGEQEMGLSMEKNKPKEGDPIQTTKLIKNPTYTRITHASK